MGENAPLELPFAKGVKPYKGRKAEVDEARRKRRIDGMGMDCLASDGPTGGVSVVEVSPV